MAVVEAREAAAVEQARRLFRAYAADTAGTTAESLRHQEFDAEVAGLPGRYAPPSGCLLPALDGDRPVGCVALRDLGGGTCEMKRLYVMPEHRGRDMGRLLVREVIRKAEVAGYRRLVPDTLPEMAGAIALYREFGFVEIDPYWDNPIERSVFLERSLTSGPPTPSRTPLLHPSKEREDP